MLHLDLNHLLVSLIIGYVIACRISFNFNRNTRICGDIHCMLCVFVLFHVWLCGMILVLIYIAPLTAVSNLALSLQVPSYIFFNTIHFISHDIHILLCVFR